ncbi:MAG: aconitase family protein [Treponemataceae bacterium]
MTVVERFLGGVPGDIVRLKADICMVNDGDGHSAVDMVEKAGDEVKASNVIVLFDHSVPAGSYDSAAIQKKLIAFAKKWDLDFAQAQGIGYQTLLDKLSGKAQILVSSGTHNGFIGAKGSLGFRLDGEAMAKYLSTRSFELKIPETLGIELAGALNPGVRAADLIYSILNDIGPDGFTGFAVEFFGAGIDGLSLNDRIVLCGTVTQAGAVTALFSAGKNSGFKKPVRFDLSQILPVVVSPSDIFSAKPINQFAGVPVQVCFVGGCNGGRIEDLRTVAGILKGKRVKVEVRAMVGFVSNSVYLQALEEGLIDIFIDSGAQVTNPGCASCRTTSIGVVGDGENMLTTGSYNFSGCAGTADSKVYIASAEAVARAALSGLIYEGSLGEGR